MLFSPSPCPRSILTAAAGSISGGRGAAQLPRRSYCSRCPPGCSAGEGRETGSSAPPRDTGCTQHQAMPSPPHPHPTGLPCPVPLTWAASLALPSCPGHALLAPGHQEWQGSVPAPRGAAGAALGQAEAVLKDGSEQLCKRGLGAGAGAGGSRCCTESKQRRALRKHPELPWPWTLQPAPGTPSWRGQQQNGVPRLPLPEAVCSQSWGKGCSFTSRCRSLILSLIHI